MYITSLAIVNVDENGATVGVELMRPEANERLEVLEEVAERYGLDAEALQAAARAALAAPDRLVEPEVAERVVV